MPSRILLIDIDGLRQDVFHLALAEDHIPNISRVIGGAEAEMGVHLDPVSTCPSVTFCAQTSIFTGRHPCQHGIAGNQFFDRFGTNNHGVPRFYAFDIGDTLAVDDAVEVFFSKKGLVNETLDVSIPTLYEIAAEHGLSSLVAHHMLARGADTWIRPDRMDIARLTKGGILLGISAEQYDNRMLDKTISRIREGYNPHVLTVYFMGLDHESHAHGPGFQKKYLTVVDKQVGRLLAELEQRSMLKNTLVIIVSDHGQIRVIPDDRYSLRISFPFDREMGYLFEALGLDIHDLPGEDPNCDAVVASNGGIAHVYLQNRKSHWKDAPNYARDVVPVARAFWDANSTGKHTADLQGALAAILIRNVERDGWKAGYQVYTPQSLSNLEDFLPAHPEIQTSDAVSRIKYLAGPQSGDLILLSNYHEGYYFGSPVQGTHGGLHPHDSLAVLTFAWIGASQNQIRRLRAVANEIVAKRCRVEQRKMPSLVDMLPVVSAIMHWG